MSIMATPIYAALLALLFLRLSVKVIMVRRKTRIAIGDQGNEKLTRAMRVQANCAEYAPLGVLLLLMVELQGAHWAAVHALGLMLLAGRVVHAWGFSQMDENLKRRVLGMQMTFLALLLTTLLALGLAIYGHARTWM